MTQEATASLPFRTLLRTEVCAVLSQLPAFGGPDKPQVFNTRLPVLRRDRPRLPSIRVATLADSRSNVAVAHPIGEFDGEVSLQVQVIIEATADPLLADKLDALCLLVETTLLCDRRLHLKMRNTTAMSLAIDLDVQGEMRTAVATIDFTVAYTDCFPLDIPDELRRIHLDIDWIDPAADPNTTGHPTRPPDGYPGGYPGPDGRIEHSLDIDLAQDDATDNRTPEAAEPGAS